MARFSGAIGFVQEVETAPGVWTAQPVEKKFKGTVTRDTRQVRDGEHVNGDISVQNLIEVVADAYATQNHHAIRYAVWNGQPWIVENVTVERPRLILRLGRRYDGPLPTPAP